MFAECGRTYRNRRKLYFLTCHDLLTWLIGNELVSINEVALRRAQLVLGWVNQLLRSTQPGHPFVGSHGVNQ